MSHDFGKPYVDQDLGVVPDAFVARVVRGGRALEVRGACPRCAGETVTEYPLGSPGNGTKGASEAEFRAGIADQRRFCECGYAHGPQPANPVFLGCGASWRVAP